MPNVKSSPTRTERLPPTTSVPFGRIIYTTAPLTGGGTLSTDLRLGLDTSRLGDVRTAGNNVLTGLNTLAGTIFQGNVQVSGGLIAYGPISAQWETTSGYIGVYGPTTGLAGTIKHGGSSISSITVAGGVLGEVDNTGGGTIYNAMGGYFAVTQTGSGVNTTGYGVYVDTVQAATAYGFYQAGIQPNILGGSLYHASVATGNRYITSGELGAASGTGTVTSLLPGSNLTFQPSPITTTGSIGLANSLNIPGAVQVSGDQIVYGHLSVGATMFGTPGAAFSTITDKYTYHFVGETSSTLGTIFDLRRYRDTAGAKTAISGGDTLGQINFRGYQFSNDYTSGAQIAALVDGPVVGTVVPGRLRIQTRDDAGTLAERMTVHASTVRILTQLQVSGVSLHYEPLYQGTETAAQRYITSGELFVTTIPPTSSGITTLNGQTEYRQVFAVDANTTNFSITSQSVASFPGPDVYGVHTFHLPNASPFARGVISTDSQTISGTKTFVGDLQTSGLLLAYAPLYQGSVAAGARYVTSGELKVGVGAGTVTTINLGSNLVMQPNPLTVTGSIGLANSLSVPGDVQVSGTTGFYKFVGIGTASPVAQLHLQGVGRGELTLDPTPGDPIITWMVSGSAKAELFWSNANRYLELYTFGSSSDAQVRVFENGGVLVRKPLQVISDLQVSGAVDIYAVPGITASSATYIRAMVSGSTSTWQTAYAQTSVAGGAAGGYLRGVYSLLQTRATAANYSGTTLIGVHAATDHFGSATAAAVYGVQADVSNVNAGIVSDARAFSATVANLGAGTITTAYGLYVDALNGTNRYAVYQAGAADANRWAGSTQFIGAVQVSGLTIHYAPAYQGAVGAASRYVVSGELKAGAGTVTSLALGSNLVMQPSPLTVTGSIGLAHNLNIPGTVQISGTTVLYQDLWLVGSGLRIRGDFSADRPNRAAFQTYGDNGSTFVQAWPNGTGTTGAFVGLGSSDYGNASRAVFGQYSDGLHIDSDYSGTGTLQPLWLMMKGTRVITISPDRDVQISGTNFIVYPSMYQGGVSAAQRYVTSGELKVGVGAGTVTTIALGSNLVMQPNPITVTGSIGLADSLSIPGDVQISGALIAYGRTDATALSIIGNPGISSSASQIRIENNESTARAIGLYRYRGTPDARTAASGVDILGSITWWGYTLAGTYGFAGELRGSSERQAGDYFQSRVQIFVAGITGGITERIGALSTGVRLTGDIQLSGQTLHYGSMYQGGVATENRYVTSGELKAGAGTGTVTTITVGNDLVIQPSPLTVTGSIGLAPNVTVPGTLTLGDPSNFSTSGVIYQRGSQFLHAYAKAGSLYGNIFLGYGAGNFTMGDGTSNVGDFNTAVGHLAGPALRTGTRNTIFGAYAGNLLQDGYYNNFIGSFAGGRSTGAARCNFIGHQSGYQHVGGTYNNYVGESAGYAGLNPTQNNWMGYGAGQVAQGSYNTGLGALAGGTLVSGQYSTFVGNAADTTNASATNSTALGSQALVTKDNQIVLGNTAVTELLTYGSAYNTSATAAQRYVVSGEYGQLAGTILQRNATTVAWANTKAEQSVVTYTVPGNVLGTTRGIRVTLAGSWKNNTGTTAIPYVIGRYGTQVIVSGGIATAQGATFRSWWAQLSMMANNATNVQAAEGRHVTGALSTHTGTFAAATNVLQATNALSVDSTTAQPLSVSVGSATASVNISGAINFALVELI